MTAAEIASREADLSATPAHPEWQRLRVERGLIEQGGRAVEYSLWWNGASALRLGMSFGESAALPWVDYAITNRAVFCLNSLQLTVLEPGVPPPPGREFVDVEALALWSMSLLARGGLGAQPFSGATFERVERDGQNAAAALRLPDGRGLDIIAVLASGPRADPAEARVQEVRLTAPDTGRPVSTYRFGDRVEAPGLPGGVAATVERFGASGNLVERWTWIGSRRMDRGEFDRVTAVPAIDGVDAVRGQVTFTSLWDYRIGQITSSAGGVLTEAPIPQYTPPPRTGPLLIWIGWVGAGVLAALLVGIRVWRTRQPGRRPYSGGVG